MTNDVATRPFGTGLASADMKSMAERAQQSAQTGQRGGAPNGSSYMNFSGKRGVYTIGEKKRPIQVDELWIVDVSSFEDGWVCWKGGKPAANRMANIYSGAPVQQPNFDEFGPFDSNRGEGWSQAKGWVCKSLDTDEQGYFKVNSVSGVSEMASLVEEVSIRMGSGRPAYPVIGYDIEEFEAQGYKNFKPIFKIEGWLDIPQLSIIAGEEEYDLDDLFAEADAGEPEGAVEETPKTATKRKAAAEPEPEEVEPTPETTAPSRRRRRAAK